MKIPARRRAFNEQDRWIPDTFGYAIRVDRSADRNRRFRYADTPIGIRPFGRIIHKVVGEAAMLSRPG